MDYVKHVKSSDGTRLAVYASQAELPPLAEIVFIHGYSQSALCWETLSDSAALGPYRLVSFDLRGSGSSDKPDDEQRYRQTHLWADDLRAVLKASCSERPFICAWSYAGRVVLDYITTYGCENIGGLILVTATSTSDPACFGTMYSTLGRLHTDDVRANVEASIALWDTCTVEPLPEPLSKKMIASTMLTPPFVRRHLSGRKADYDQALRSISVPTLLIHGAADQINTVGMSHHAKALIESAEMLVYPDVGHCPFLERPEQFASDMRAFVDKNAASGRSSNQAPA